MDKYKHIIIKDVCRLCLNKSDYMSLLSEPEIKNMLYECASIQLEEKGTQYICNLCDSQVKQWFAFKEKILHSIQIGKWLLEQNVFEGISDDIDIHSASEFPSDEIILESNSDIFETKNDSTIFCERCGTEFITIQLLNKHIKYDCNLGKKKSLECTKCGKVFKQAQSLRDHIKRHYDSRNYACELCGKKFYKPFNVTEHMRIHTGERPFSCEYCMKTFTRNLLLRNHIRKEHTGETKFTCELCSKSFVDGYQLKMHLRTHTGEKPFSCEHCNMTFAMRGQLKSHVKYKHTKEKDFICNICARAFTAKHTLDEHLRTHTGEKKKPRHECHYCGKMCITTTQLKIHIQSKHTNIRPFQCDLCTKAFHTRTVLEAHFKVHTGEKSFICEQCGKAFSAKSSLKIHERIHTGIRPYQCHVCDKFFTQRSTMKTHLKTHGLTMDHL